MPSRIMRQRKRQRQRALRVGYEGPHFSARQWRKLLKRYGRACLSCGVTEPISVDHVVPLSLGGPNTIENIQPLCVTCNNAKGLAVVDYRRRP